MSEKLSINLEMCVSLLFNDFGITLEIKMFNFALLQRRHSLEDLT